jgi:LmbE family N-acetylglucosaminyl deacetylase
MNKVTMICRAALCCFGVFLGGLTGVRAQGPATVGSAEIFLRLKKLNVLGTVLYVAAHPDDENSRLIAYMAKDRLYRTGYLSMTRGDGGQNLIGDEQGVDLGLIRTQEMLAARRVDGAEQFFSRAFDFGFSKSTDEALRTWNKEKILSDVVWVIRKFQPDVIITRFPEDSRAGHGHHSASAVLAHEAFAAAADPNRFPEQFKYGVKPWQAKRLLWNGFNFGPGANTTNEDQMKIDVGGYNPILGKSYGEMAAESRTNHKSQGAALTPARGQSMEYFAPVAGDPAHGDPMEGVETGWRRVDGGEKISGMVDQLIRDYSLSSPEKSVPGLVGVYKAIMQLPDGPWKKQKQKEVRELIEACSGLWLEAVVETPYVTKGDPLSVTFVVNNRLNATIAVREIRIETPAAWSEMTGYLGMEPGSTGASAAEAVVPGGAAGKRDGAGKRDAVDFDTVWHQQLDGDKNYSFSHTFIVSPERAITQPYWLTEPMSPGRFNVTDQRLIGNPQSPPAYEAEFDLVVDGQEMTLTVPVQYKHTDAVKGELYEPLTVLPHFTAQLNPALLLFTGNETKTFKSVLMNRSIHQGFTPQEFTPVGGVRLTTANNGAMPAFQEWTAVPDGKTMGVATADLVFGPGNGRKDTALEQHTIAYDHIPRIDYFQPAVEKFVQADVKTAGHRIGYIEGAGDKVPQALRQMGYEVVMVSEKDMDPGYLQQFDAIIAGVRAYDVHPWLTARYTTLMEYVKNGGNLVVQYNRNALGQVKSTIGPYPFAVANARVTDESAKVNFLLPDHKVLNYPNKISDKDFDGWIQERGIYFAGQTDPAYQSVLSMKDPGESEQKGSLVIADYGKGVFVYTGLVFFRELPAGVPGAYRLMANIIALNQKKGF